MSVAGISAGASPGVAGIRAQRTEVEALLAFTHAREGKDKARAWWRLHLARTTRIAQMDKTTAARLPTLPDPPPGALTRMQMLGLRFGWLRLERAKPAARFAAD